MSNYVFTDLSKPVTKEEHINELFNELFNEHQGREKNTMLNNKNTMLNDQDIFDFHSIETCSTVKKNKAEKNADLSVTSNERDGKKNFTFTFRIDGIQDFTSVSIMTMPEYVVLKFPADKGYIFTLSKCEKPRKDGSKSKNRYIQGSQQDIGLWAEEYQGSYKLLKAENGFFYFSKV